MHTEIDAGDRVIKLSLTVDEAEAFMEGMGTLTELGREKVARLQEQRQKIAEFHESY